MTSANTASSAARIAVVTGGARGIGWATVEALLAGGIVPVVFDRDEQALARAEEALGRAGVDALALSVDVTEEAAVDAAFARVLARYGRIDILVNNAGSALRRPTLELSVADWQTVVDLNQTAVFVCCRAALRAMSPARRGAIVNVASIMGLSGGGPYPNLSYHASKGAVVNMTRALAVEWAPHGIRVNAVAPAWVRTDLTQKLLSDPAMVERILALTPMGCLVEATDVAAAIVFLASDAARAITGHTLPIDCGYLAQ